MWGKVTSSVGSPVEGSVWMTRRPLTMRADPDRPLSEAVQLLEASPSGEPAWKGSLSWMFLTDAVEVTEPPGPVVPDVWTVSSPWFSKM